MRVWHAVRIAMREILLLVAVSTVGIVCGTAAWVGAVHFFTRGNNGLGSVVDVYVTTGVWLGLFLAGCLTFANRYRYLTQTGFTARQKLGVDMLTFVTCTIIVSLVLYTMSSLMPSVQLGFLRIDMSAMAGEMSLYRLVLFIFPIYAVLMFGSNLALLADKFTSKVFAIVCAIVTYIVFQIIYNLVFLNASRPELSEWVAKNPDTVLLLFSALMTIIFVIGHYRHVSKKARLS